MPHILRVRRIERCSEPPVLLVLPATVLVYARFSCGAPPVASSRGCLHQQQRNWLAGETILLEGQAFVTLIELMQSIAGKPGLDSTSLRTFQYRV